MGTVIHLKTYRDHKIGRCGFAYWQKRFGEIYNHKTRIPDLTAKTLLYLSSPGEESTAAFFELIMGVLGLGPAENFSALEKEEQVRVIDIHLFVLDQVRLEIMQRLNWLQDYPGFDATLVDMIRGYEPVREKWGKRCPRLSNAHPDFKDYQSLSPREKEGFVRRMVPQSLEAFRAIVENKKK